ncbi:activity-regulated cytoskeleton associated protein 2-like [Stomoxys calcitrans]|uniref:activity-regulated cytoskeleton associated protein 2-like n=1 Tax=Stomoxys calcitrans TaxID=35570 RepID=UPI0027E2C63A|nr:activity-regulated cytoskeleton associated protein 2-like [Stomoxys calcitrans]
MAENKNSTTEDNACNNRTKAFVLLKEMANKHQVDKSLTSEDKVDNSMHDEKKFLLDLIAQLQDTIDSQSQAQKNTMAGCKVRFSGQQHSEAVEEFINGIQTYKLLQQIDDEDALKGISLLFTGLAAIWWQGVHKEVNTWSNCLELIQEHFAPKKPPHQLYVEIFQEAQDEKTSMHMFIIRKRALFAQLPEGRHSEEIQIDMMYGLLNFKYRQHMRRDEIHSFQDLFQKGRDIEQINMEKTKPKRCSFCNYRGHTAEECRKRQQKHVGERKKV